MATMLERNKKVKAPEKTMQEHAQDALYREVWEDVNNEKTQQFIKKYGKHMLAAALGIMIIVTGIQIGLRAHAAAKLATAENYETAIDNADVNALVGIAGGTSGATADLALFQAYVLDGDIKKLETLVADGNTRQFRDLARMHIVAARGDDMDAAAVGKYLAELDTKDSPFYYTSALTIAKKYISVGDRAAANKWLSKILDDAAAPAVIRAEAETLR
ncbi:MAG: hypothetical protein J5611_02360 [Alphaproteobacteria bacterium]|nr:hypothetical protein [Alphaproteobacteria bacterium]